MLVHREDFDDVHYGAKGHPACMLFPGLISMLDAGLISHTKVLDGYLIGTEIMAYFGERLGLPLQNHGLHPTSIIGSAAAAAAMTWALGGNAQEVQRTLRMVTSQAHGVLTSSGGSAKAHQVAAGASLAIRNALIARGMQSTLNPHEWIYNLQAKVQCDIESPQRSFADPWAIDVDPVRLKSLPICAHFMPVLRSFADLMVNEDIGDFTEKIVVTVPAQVRHASRFITPEDYDQASFSLPYALACIAVEKRPLETRDFRSENIFNPKVQALSRKVFLAPLKDETPDPKGRIMGVVAGTDTLGCQKTWEAQVYGIDLVEDWSGIAVKKYFEATRAMPPQRSQELLRELVEYAALIDIRTEEQEGRHG